MFSPPVIRTVEEKALSFPILNLHRVLVDYCGEEDRWGGTAGLELSSAHCLIRSSSAALGLVVKGTGVWLEVCWFDSKPRATPPSLSTENLSPSAPASGVCVCTMPSKDVSLLPLLLHLPPQMSAFWLIMYFQSYLCASVGSVVIPAVLLCVVESINSLDV